MRYAGDLKLGLALDQQADWEASHPGATNDDRMLAYREIRQNLDAAMGQYNWRNSITPRWMKDTLQAATFAPAWTGGNLAQFYLAARDTAVKAGRKGNPAVTPAMANVPAVLATWALYGAIYQALSTYLRTGKSQQPESWQDLYEPRTGRMNPDGTPERVTAPGPLKDYSLPLQVQPSRGVHMLDQPLESLSHKLSLGIGTAVELVKNKDYYGHEISTPKEGESAMGASVRWTGDALKHLGKKGLADQCPERMAARSRTTRGH